MRIERLTAVSAADRETLLDLWVAAWAAAGSDMDVEARRPAFSARIAEHLDAGADPIMARSDADGPLLGYALVNVAARYLDQIATDPAHQGRGIASLLLGEAKRLCPDGLGLHVGRTNARAIRLYRRHGFVTVGEGLNPRSGLPIFAMLWRPDGRPERGS